MKFGGSLLMDRSACGMRGRAGEDVVSEQTCQVEETEAGDKLIM